MNPPQEAIEHPYLLMVDPFKIKGNLYFVGTAQCSTHLIDTGDGLIIIDVPCIQDMPFMLNNIWRAGFDPHDIKLIIISHAHVDHYGSVNAMRRFTGAEVALSKVDAADMAKRADYFKGFVQKFGPNNENFVPDRVLEDGEIVEMGNTKIRCVLIPGHTRGTMAHFWDVEEGGKTYKVGIYGGAGFVTLTEEEIAANDLTMAIRDDFSHSIEKVWDEPVDIMLGNHPFHNDTWKKRLAQLEGAQDAFVDPVEWHRFLQELKDSYANFLSLDSEGVHREMGPSRFEEYTGRYLEEIDQLSGK